MSRLIAVALIAMASAASVAQDVKQEYRFGLHEPGFLERYSESTMATVVPVQTVSLSPSELGALRKAKFGQSVGLPSFSLGLSKRAQLQFRRIALYDRDSRVRVLGSRGTTYMKPSNRAFFLAVDGAASAGFSLNRDTGEVRGLLTEGEETIQFRSSRTKEAKNELTFTRIKDTHKDAVFSCEVDQQAQRAFDSLRAPALPYGSLNATRKGTLLYQTTIAVDTDNEFLFNKFNNNDADAQTWIEDLFLNMNTIFERDLNMRLLIGDVMLRVDDDGTPDFNQDPYGDNDGLTEFGLYWQQNLTGIDRDFAMMLSNKGVSELSFSGVAWVEAYCINIEVFPGSGFGSFSFNRIGTNPLIDPAFTSGGIGHELGHNLGSLHTHCEMLAAGGTDWVDHCYNEATGAFPMQTPDPGCYQGATECPADGVGSLMSYCHAPPEGFDNFGPGMDGIENGPPASPSCTNSDVMDPLIIGKLSGLIADNNPSCIADFGVVQPIFASGFEDGE